MDIAKYIGLFLEKNRYCFLPNLGEFTITKKSAKIKEDQLTAPEYDIDFKFSGGLIDDSLAYFVANSERISIASAANAIKDFSVATRATLAEGGTVEIPGFGKFVNNGGQNKFIADTSFTVSAPPSIPVFKNVSEQNNIAKVPYNKLADDIQFKNPTSDEEIIIKPASVDWGKILLLSFIVLAILGAGFGAYWYMSKNITEEAPVVAAPVEPVQTTTVAQPDSTVVDSNAMAQTTVDTSGVKPAAVATPQGSVAFGILNFTDKAKAERKEKQLKSFGNNTSLVENSDGTFTIVITVANVTDAAHVQDSLRKFFNPSGTVSIIK